MFNYDRFATLIDEKGVKKSYLCTLVGRPRHYVNDVIRQKNKIPLEYQQIFADALGTTVEYLNGETDQKEKAARSTDLSDDIKEIMELAQSMSNAEIALLLEKAKRIKGV